jgi:predicted RNA methylase
MSLDSLDDVIRRQAELIAALDTMDAAAITNATEALAAALSISKSKDYSGDRAAARERIGHALQQSHAAAIRINSQMHWTRQRIDRIAELRGMGRKTFYSSY